MYGIGIGQSDFRALRIRENYYIDKTMYIRDIIDNEASVLLVTRPRRFGKTLNMSMLKYYFDCTKKDSKELFEGLKIMEQEEKYTSKLGYYPCIYLTLKDAGLISYEMMIMQLKTIMMELYYENRYLLEKAEMALGERNLFNKILAAEANEVDLINSVKILSKILSNYYTPRRDSIYIDGTDINDISISNLKDNITTISQEEIIFNDTIKNNIILNRKISDNKFIKICRELCIDEFVKNSPMGYNTKLEENGQNISGGQRQRIILARALLKNSNILLIDEGLNAIDINLERKILKTIFEKYQDKTIIIVSHRLENMDLYKKVINLKDGKIDKIANLPKEGDYYV